MADEIKDGGAAFPRTAASGEHEGSGGMSLRDYFAGQCLAEMAARVMFPQIVEDNLHRAGIKTEDFESYVAHVAYGFADAMLVERGRRRG